MNATDYRKQLEPYTICPVCKKRYASEVHHIMHGADKRLSEKFYRVCLIPLCTECHYEVHHGNGENLDLKLKQQAQMDFELFYPDENWFEVFGRNYI